MPLRIVRNDITKMKVDAIVNAANETLLGGGGVDGAIHRAAGPKLLQECRKLGGCETGRAKLTKGYDLPCRYVIHTVGPVWRGGRFGEAKLLASCYRESLLLAAEHRCETVAFPMISTGVYGYPAAEAMRVAVDAVTAFLLDHDMTVYIVVFSRDAFEISGRLFNDVKAYIDDVYVDRHTDMRREQQRSVRLFDAMMAEPAAKAAAPASLDDMLSDIEDGFSETLLRMIDAKGLTDAECYKRANMDRRHFNKIKNNPSYRPTKSTALAFAVALRLSIDETKQLLMKAGYALTHSSKQDIVVEYCIKNGIYDIIEIDQVLFKFDLPLLGS